MVYNRYIKEQYNMYIHVGKPTREDEQETYANELPYKLLLIFTSIVQCNCTQSLILSSRKCALQNEAFAVPTCPPYSHRA